ncbi:MAG: terminase gpA endonuclease subunit, partial [Limisphaerales bacterium]
THLEQQFRGCTLTFIGSNSPADLSSRPIRIMVADEVDKFASSTDKEADALELAEDRLKGFSSSKEFLTSTPTLSEGRIWQRFLAGDQRRYWIPCPHCSQFIQLLWKQVRWDQDKLDGGEWDYPKVRTSARYECQLCNAHITDAQKVTALRHGEWRPESQGALPGVRSYHLSSLYSPDRKCTWGQLAVKFLKAKDSFVGLQGFINGALAEPWENQEGAAAKVELVSAPDAPGLEDSMILLTADHQALAPYFWVVVREWDKTGNSRLRGCYTCDDWDTIRRIQLAFGIKDSGVTIDSRHNPDEVREMCLRYGQVHRLFAQTYMHVGWTPWDGQRSDWRKVDEKTGIQSPVGLSKYGVPLTRRVGYNLHSLMYAGDFFLSLLARLRTGPAKAGGLRWELVEFPCGPNVEGAQRVNEETYRRHLDAKRYEPRAVRRRVVWEWTKRSSRWPDHLLDCEIAQIAWAALHNRLPMTIEDEDGGRVRVTARRR